MTVLVTLVGIMVCMLYEFQQLYMRKFMKYHKFSELIFYVFISFKVQTNNANARAMLPFPYDKHCDL